MLDFSKAFHLMCALECLYNAEREGKFCLKRLERSLDLKVTLKLQQAPFSDTIRFLQGRA